MSLQEMKLQHAKRRQQLVETICELKTRAGAAAWERNSELMLLAQLSLTIVDFATDLLEEVSAIQAGAAQDPGAANLSCIRVMCGARVQMATAEPSAPHRCTPRYVPDQEGA